MSFWISRERCLRNNDPFNMAVRLLMGHWFFLTLKVHAGGPVANWQCGKVRICRSQLQRQQAVMSRIVSAAFF